MRIKITNAMLGAAVLASVVSCSKDEISSPEPEQIKIENLITYEGSQVIPNQYIVVLQESSLPNNKKSLNYQESNDLVSRMAEDILGELGDNIPILQTFATLNSGFVANLTEVQVKELSKNSLVSYIEQDQIISLKKPGGTPGGGNGGGGGTPPPQTTPWGISSVGGNGDGSILTKKAWIIDSGIDLDHPDLNVDVNNSKSFLNGKQSTNPDDQNGHGTHVAGTVAAIDNQIGVVGVAAGARVVSVRVLDRRGSGTTSGVIAGVNYVAANASSGDVANMSLGGGTSTTLDNAVSAAANINTGIYFVIAAGNSSADANNSSPARVNGNFIYTISAMDVNNNFASFSNYGNPPIDYCAPGVSIPSTYKDGGYATLSGTSMAAPHVAGILMLGTINTNGTVTGDSDGTADPIAIR